MKISIFTPTYNRGHLLPRLFASLQKQSFRDFEWIIVDDGSTDDTKAVVRDLLQKADFGIQYLYQRNSGKHVAHNTAAASAKGELFLCVDSDDYLKANDTLDELVGLWDQHSHDESIMGILSKKEDNNGQALCTPLPTEIACASPFFLEKQYQCKGEWNITYRTDFVQSHLYPVFPNETFFPDSYISDELSKKYKVWIHDRFDVICEYLPDGLSRKFRMLMKNNPHGFCYANMNQIDLHNSLSGKFGSAIRYWAFKFMCHDDAVVYSGPHIRFVQFCKIVGWLLFHYYHIRLT